MSYRYEIPALLDRLLEDLFEDNYETYEDGYALPLVLDDPEWSMVQLREIFSRVSEALKEAEKMYAADISLKEKNEIEMKKENTD